MLESETTLNCVDLLLLELLILCIVGQRAFNMLRILICYVSYTYFNVFWIPLHFCVVLSQFHHRAGNVSEVMACNFKAENDYFSKFIYNIFQRQFNLKYAAITTKNGSVSVVCTEKIHDRVVSCPTYPSCAPVSSRKQQLFFGDNPDINSVYTIQRDKCFAPGISVTDVMLLGFFGISYNINNTAWIFGMWHANALSRKV